MWHYYLCSQHEENGENKQRPEVKIYTRIWRSRLRKPQELQEKPCAFTSDKFKGTLFVKFTRLAEPSEARCLLPSRQEKRTHWALTLWSISNNSHWRRNFLPGWEIVGQNGNWSCSNFLNTGKLTLVVVWLWRTDDCWGITFFYINIYKLKKKTWFFHFSVQIRSQAPRTVLMCSTDAYFPIRCDKWWSFQQTPQSHTRSHPPSLAVGRPQSPARAWQLRTRVPVFTYCAGRHWLFMLMSCHAGGLNWRSLGFCLYHKVENQIYSTEIQMLAHFLLSLIELNCVRCKIKVRHFLSEYVYLKNPCPPSRDPV